MLKFTINVEKGKDGWLISDVVELPGCHTQAKTLAELFKRTGEAASAYLKVKTSRGVLDIEVARRLEEIKGKKVKTFTEKDYKKFIQKMRSE